ncbi:AAA family ATPase [Streptomyces sp. NPDC101393]|uniref:AAA family ATPase n=1 Tax=Streptomyces sp. NPDC101393 TaxID=3366141 RepID=UPI003823380F
MAEKNDGGAPGASVGRGQQLRELKDTFSRCLTGAAGTVILQSPAGFGRTALLSEFARYAEHCRATVLRITGTKDEQGISLAGLRQLLDEPALPARVAEPLRTVLAGRNAAGTTDAPVGPAGARAVRLALHDLAGRAPVVIMVDDMQYVDGATLRHLLAAVSFAGASPLLLVLTESEQARRDDPALRTLFLQQPNLVRMYLPPLRPQDVAELLNGTLGPTESQRCASAWWAVSGGNPLLLRALTEDHRAAAIARPPASCEPRAGEAFVAAVRSLLKRSGPLAEDLFNCLSVLGRAASPELLSLMLDVSRGAVNGGLQALGAIGLVDGCRVRHPLVQSTLLDEWAPQVRAALHHRAAELLHRTGGSSPEVAGHLLAAGPSVPSGRWAVDVLRCAAEQVLAGDAPLAVRFLHLACAACTDPVHRVEIRLRLAAVLLRLDPCAVEGHLVEPLALLHAGTLPESCAGPLARLLLALGRFDDARGTLHRFDGAGENAPDTSDVYRVLNTSLFPASLTSVAAPPAAPAVSLPVRRIRDEPALLVAEGSLQLLALTEATFEPAATALSALVRGDRSAGCEAWWGSLTGEARGWQTPGWRTILSMIRGEMFLWQGSLHEAVDCAAASLDGVTEEVGSVFAAGALATQILAYTAMGRLSAAARQLSRPVQDSVFRSVYGLKYLRARGHYYLATGRAHAALGEFLTAGRLAQQWKVDQPVLLPWSLDAAEAWLRIGEREPAERLIRSQLTPAGGSRVRGAALRMHAAVSEPALRPRTLAQAVAELESSGDRLELARALADLGRAHRALGEFSRAGVITDRAWQMAKECGAEALCEAIRPGCLKAHEQSPPDDARSSPISQLSDSEMRVAALAAQGSTNREIAAELYITVSTVEQHLTRVYRKLNIRGRRQLTMNFAFGAEHINVAS